MSRKNGSQTLGVLWAIGSALWNSRAWAAPSGQVKIGWFPPGQPAQMAYTTGGITVGSAVQVTVDVTYSMTETYTVTPGGLAFSEDVGHSDQSRSWGSTVLTSES